MSTEIKNIIFDLGGVVLDIDFQLSIDAFSKISNKNIEKIIGEDEYKLFEKLDMGLISADEFRHELKKHLPDINDLQIDNAWNKLLIGYPEENIKTLLEVKENYNIFLLSNTNAIHFPVYNNMLKKNFNIDGLDKIFKHLYLTFEMEMYKPQPEIFEFILKDQNIKAEQTLFIDDTLKHINVAKKLGFITVHLTKDKSIDKLFENGMLREYEGVRV